jgi:hypothetical protein
MAYATTAQLATYLGIAEGSLPADASRMLDRATDMIDYAVLNNDVTGFETETANACCAQVEWWIETGDELGVGAEISSMKLSEFSVNYSGSSSSSPNSRQSQHGPLCARAYEYLFRAGLLYRGVGLKI